MPRSLIVAALLVSGCTLIAGYGPIGDETSAAACSNGDDDDLDGRIDCEDESCTGHGHCVEASPQACTNGDDDDGDQLADEHDPACWPYSTVTVDRSCARIAGTHALDGARAPLPWGDIHFGTRSPAVEERIDASGARTIVFPASDEALLVVGDEVITGDLAGLRLHMELDVVPGRWFEVGLVFDERFNPITLGSADGVGFLAHPESGRTTEAISVSGGRNDLPRSLRNGSPEVTARAHLVVDIETGLDASGTAIVVSRVTVNGGAYENLPWGSLSAADLASRARGVRVYGRAEAATFADAEVSFTNVTVDRPDIDGCGGTSAAPVEPAFGHRVLSVVELADGRLCALVAASAPEYASTRVERFVTTGPCGGAWRSAGTALEGLSRVSTAAIARRPDGRLDVALGHAEYDRLPVNQLAFLTWTTLPGGCDDGEWDPHAPRVPANTPIANVVGGSLDVSQEKRATVLGLEVDDDFTRHLVVVDRDDTALIHLDLSSEGSTTLGRTTPIGDDVLAIVGVGVGTLHGNPILATLRYDGAVELVVPGEDGLRGRVPLFVPGSPPGAYDDAGGAFPSFLAFDPAGTCPRDGVVGLLFVGAEPAGAADDTIDTGVFPVRVRGGTSSGSGDAGVAP